MPKPTPIKKQETDPQDIETLAKQYADAMAANANLVQLLTQAADAAINLGVNIKAAMRPA